MAKRLSDISNFIDSRASLFRARLERLVDPEVVGFINQLSKKCDVYIFSGVIRNFFLNIPSNRDIDIVIDGSVNLEHFLEGISWKINSFNGYKLAINDVNIDLWYLKNTWALTYQATIEYDLAKFIPHTAFFNFASIVYYYNGNKFYHTRDFDRFCRDKVIDITYYPNANIPLCIVNSIYYSDSFGFPLGKRLLKYIKNKFKPESNEYAEVQLKHFGEIKYSNELLQKRINGL